MIVHVTSIKTKPGSAEKIVQLLYRDEIITLCREFNLLSMLTVESNQEPGLILSTSAWESLEAAQTAMSNPAYADLVKGMAQFFTAAPERSSYKVLRYQPLGDAKPGMFLNNTILRVKPENVEALLDILHSEKNLARTQGLEVKTDIWALEPHTEPGTINSISIWESPKAAQNVFAAPFYAELLSKMKHLFVAAPERFGFTVLQSIRLEKLAPV